MGRITVGRATFLVAILGLLATQAVVGCGSTSTPDKATGGQGAEGGGSTSGGRSGDGAAGTGESGSPAETGGVVGAGGRGGGSSTAGSGGSLNAGGGKGLGGAPNGGASGGLGKGGAPISTGGMNSATGGAPGCLEGAPCTCKKLVGTTECTGSEATCSCPPAAECAPKADAPCFEPCGGEPFGAWVLTDACFGSTSTTTGNADCKRVTQGTPADNDLRLRILDGGEMEVYGQEDWSISAQASLACFQVSTVKSCPLATLWSEALLFTTQFSSTCAANACGVCDCTTDARLNFGFIDFWSREGNNLNLAGNTVSYCATEDELWIGGSDDHGTPKVSYKFKKQSCTGTPVACSARTKEQCVRGTDCRVGLCKAKTGTVPGCATAFSSAECGVLQACVWDPDGCAGTAPTSCEFGTCGEEPGCTWGAPKERCGGDPWACENREPSQCTTGGAGCAVRPCGPQFQENGECSLLTSATECGKAPGCAWAAATGCSGQSLCIAQTDTAVCTKLNCLAQPYCVGTPTACNTLSVATCHDVLGCRLEW